MDISTSAGLPLFKEILLGEKLIRGRDSKIKLNTHTQTHFLCFPTERTLTEAALPVTVVAIILQALSTDRLLQVSTLLNTSLGKRHTLTHLHWAYKMVHKRPHPHVHILCIFTVTHGCAFHPQFPLHKLMARVNCSSVVGADILLAAGENTQ